MNMKFQVSKLVQRTAFAALLSSTLCVGGVAAAQGNETIAQKAKKVKLQGKYKIVDIQEAFFKTGLSMLAKEQDEYAEHLTNFALNQIVLNNGNQESLSNARKYIALALHLSPRNKGAVIANFQLSKGLLPRKINQGFSAKALSSLLTARAKMQSESKEVKDQQLSGYFSDLAAGLNPENEDAVYAAQMYKMDNGVVNWALLTGK